MLAQIKVTKTKGTLSCVGALRRCPARLRPKEDSRKLAALRATQISGCLFLFRPPLLGAAPKGAIQAKTGSRTLRQDREALFVGQRRRRVRSERSQTPQLRRSSCSIIAVHRRFAPARNPSVFFFAYFLLDKQKKVSRTAVRNKRTDELVSGSKYSVSEVRILSNRLHQSEWNSAWVCKEPLSLEAAELHEKAALGRL